MKAEHTCHTYAYTSKLASSINDFISNKRALFSSHCNAQAYRMYLFDQFLVEADLDQGVITKDIVKAYANSMSARGLTPATREARLSTLHDFSLFRLKQGLESYLWSETIKNVKGQHRRPYIPSDEELKVFCAYLNRYLVTVPLLKRHFSLSCSVMVRLYSLCGLRNSEATDLLREEVRFSDNTLYIRHSKGDKDRIVPVNDEIAALLKRCDEFLEQRFPNREYFFVNQKGARTIHADVAAWFCTHWQRCFGEKTKDQRPTVQDLRHTFVVRCVDRWGGEAGADFAVKFPLLSKYIGHSSVQHTLYYYHQFRGVGQLAEGWIMSCNGVAKGVCDAILK